MEKYVDLERRFVKLTRAELADPDGYLEGFDAHPLGSIGWDQLLEHQRVIILAEAGSGKTREMQQQATKLMSAGNVAFFIPIEGLQLGHVVDQLSLDDESKFRNWQNDETATAWFFLDAVDELKLTEGKLGNALRRFAKDIGNRLSRARVIISCRPNDWLADFDLNLVEQHLPIEAIREERSTSPEEAFLELIRERSQGEKKEKVDAMEAEQPLTVVMAPMSDKQIETFANALGVADATAFLTELRRQNAWTFARRPFDLIELVRKWMGDGRLGTRASQHETNATIKLQDSPGRPDKGVLSSEKARDGAERLALGLALTRMRTLRSPDQSLDPSRAIGVLDPNAILVDWTAQEQNALLRRGLFDPATYGRVRFHHRSVQEYLAASRLRKLRERGMSFKAISRILFAEKYGTRVVLPSMRAIAAWLALWDQDVFRELLDREPEALLMQGDPESITLANRSALLRRFAELYGGGGDRGIQIPVDEARRIAHPELAPVVRELWASKPASGDVRELLLEMIWQGPIAPCADIAEQASKDIQLSPYQRITAVRAVIACDDAAAARGIARSMISDPAAWPDRVVYGVAAELFPKSLSGRELVRLVRRTREPKKTVGGFSWALRGLALESDPITQEMTGLRNELARLIFYGRRKIKQEFWRKRSRYEYLSDGLATICVRQLADTKKPSQELIQACVVAATFRDDYHEERIEEIAEHFRDDLESRESAFWVTLRIVDKLFPGRNDWDRLYYLMQKSLLKSITEADRPWLETAASAGALSTRRGVALQALIQLWHLRGGTEKEAADLLARVSDDAALTAAATDGTKRREPSFRMRKHERDTRRRKRIAEVREARRVQEWNDWRTRVLANPGRAFSATEEGRTISNVYKLLSFANKEHAYGIWNRQVVEDSFGSDFADRAENSFAATWRKTNPVLWSERANNKKGEIFLSWIYGLCGLQAEASRSGWSKALTADEARLATRYALVEMNGFPEFLKDLVIDHQADVELIIGNELDAQLKNGGEQQHVSILQDIAGGPLEVQRLLTKRLMKALRAVPKKGSKKIQDNWANHMGTIVGILKSVDDDSLGPQIADTCRKGLEAQVGSPLWIAWLRALFSVDPVDAADRLAAAIREGTVDTQKAGIAAFATLFGHHGPGLPALPEGTRARVLGKLVRAAYSVVKPRDDYQQEGVRAIGTREDAEYARGFLLSALLETPGFEAQSEILRMASEPEFAHFPDRLRMLARQRAASDAEFQPFSAADVAELEARFELPANDRDSLFELMLDRIDDLNHFFQHHDFSDRAVVRRSKDEVDMQRTIASRLSAASNGSYIITREEEVADAKETDIRFLAPNADQKAVSEIKVADQRWSIADYERALRNQIVGQYLRHKNCKAGCLLLTYDGSKRYWVHPVTGKRINFNDLLDYLNELAAQIEREHGGTIRLAVRGLDLSDPDLAPAHRSGKARKRSAKKAASGKTAAKKSKKVQKKTPTPDSGKTLRKKTPAKKRQAVLKQSAQKKAVRKRRVPGKLAAATGVATKSAPRKRPKPAATRKAPTPKGRGVRSKARSR